MKRDRKGQRVKTFKYFIPNSDMTSTETQATVFFKPETGMFTIYQGAHMFTAARDKARGKYDSRTLSIFENRVSADRLDDIVRGFEYLCGVYAEEMKNAHKKKVIRFTFKANAPWYTDHEAALSDISFCGSPAIHFTYEILQQVGDQVYEQTEEGSKLQYRGSAKEARGRSGDAITVDWTEEREEFFKNMQGSLITLIHRVNDFQKDLLTNVDKAI